MQTQIEIAFDLNYINKETFEKIYELSREIERMLGSLIKKIRGS
ncbi:MAG: four helix bundle protein [Candidatus Hydrogenedentota bacterium]